MGVVEITQVLANLAAIIAALGVIGSLVFLSMQVRDNSKLINENTKAQLMAADMSSNDSAHALAFEIIRDEKMAQLILNGFRGIELSAVDQYRFEQFVRSIIESHMTFFVQRQRGTVTDEIFAYWSRYFDRLCRGPGFVQSYETMKRELPQSFCEYMDKKIASQTKLVRPQTGSLE